MGNDRTVVAHLLSTLAVMPCEEEARRSKTGGMGEVGATSGKDEECRSGLSGWI